MKARDGAEFWSSDVGEELIHFLLTEQTSRRHGSPQSLERHPVDSIDGAIAASVPSRPPAMMLHLHLLNAEPSEDLPDFVAQRIAAGRNRAHMMHVDES
jgi:hypothetical protein